MAWRSPYVERLVGSIRRECLDRVIVFNEWQLRQILDSYFDYCHKVRPIDRSRTTVPFHGRWSYRSAEK
jgi:hypothetical protein